MLEGLAYTAPCRTHISDLVQLERLPLHSGCRHGLHPHGALAAEVVLGMKQRGTCCLSGTLGGIGCGLQSTSSRAGRPAWVILRPAEDPRCELSAGIACNLLSARLDVCHIVLDSSKT